MSDLKSAWEIAMEKAKKLDTASLAELKKGDEERCRMAGMAIAERYFTVKDPRQLADDLNKYHHEEEELVRRAVVSGLAGAITLGDSEKLDKAIEGIVFLIKNELVKETGDKIKQLFQQYGRAEKEKVSDINIKGKELLEQMGIAGKAVKAINPEAREGWKKDLKEMALPFEKELEKYKQEILSLIN